MVVIHGKTLSFWPDVVETIPETAREKNRRREEIEMGRSEEKVWPNPLVVGCMVWLVRRQAGLGLEVAYFSVV